MTDPAQEELFTSQIPLLVRHFAKITGDIMLAEDLVQDGALVVMKRLRSLTSGTLDSPRAYFFGVVRRLYLGQLRKQHRRATVAVASPPDVAGTQDVALVWEKVSQRRWLMGAVDRMQAPRDRALLTRLVVCHQDKASICDALDLSARHYDRVLFRATDRLSALL